MGVQVEQLSSQTETQPPQSSKIRSKVNYVRELKQELKKVTWTTKEELILFTKIVVGATFVLGLGIYVTDLAIKGLLNGFGMLVHLIFG